MAQTQSSLLQAIQVPLAEAPRLDPGGEDAFGIEDSDGRTQAKWQKPSD